LPHGTRDSTERVRQVRRDGHVTIYIYIYIYIYIHTYTRNYVYIYVYVNWLF